MDRDFEVGDLFEWFDIGGNSTGMAIFLGLNQGMPGQYELCWVTFKSYKPGKFQHIRNVERACRLVS